MAEREAFAIAMALKPLGFAFLMATIVIPLEMLLMRIWPQGRIKNLVFDRTFDKRHPVIFTSLIVLFYIVLIAAIILYTQSRVSS
jgi:hypothetical protein